MVKIAPSSQQDTPRSGDERRGRGSHTAKCRSRERDSTGKSKGRIVKIQQGPGTCGRGDGMEGRRSSPISCPRRAGPTERVREKEGQVRDSANRTHRPRSSVTNCNTSANTRTGRAGTVRASLSYMTSLFQARCSLTSKTIRTLRWVYTVLTADYSYFVRVFVLYA
jgi:hypothetical protein